MTLSRREKFLIVFGSIIVSVAIYVMYFLIPFLTDSADTLQRQITAQAQIDQLQQISAGSAMTKKEIAEKEAALKEKGGTISDGLDHAEILLYLDRLTNGRAKDVTVHLSPDQPVQHRFLTQSVVMEFRTTWPLCQAILADLKKNGLYNRIEYVSTEYRKPEAASEPTVGETASPESTAAPKDKNVIFAHIELTFYAFQPTVSAAPATEPADANRRDSLFPPE